LAAHDDLDLQSLFIAEIEERAARLQEGAAGLGTGSVDQELLVTMVREGHTIKGTARMMGYTAVSDAGKLLEDGWRALRDGEVKPAPDLAESLGMLTRELVAAVHADPASGTPGLAAGMRSLRASLQPPEQATESRPGEETVDASVAIAEIGDLDGLLGTIGSIGFGDNVRVDAANLYRLINELCSLRVEADVLSALAEADDDADRERVRDMVGGIGAAVGALQQRAVDLAAMPLSEITATFTQLVRYVARRGGKELRFELVGDDAVADRQVVERLSDPLRHLLVNAVEHGVETPEERIARGKPRTATLALHAQATHQRLTITVEDDGRGVDWAQVRRAGLERGLISGEDADDRDALRALLFSPHFSTLADAELVGEGMGLTIVARAVESLQGTLTFETEPGAGTRVVIAVPRSRALQDAVIVRSAGQAWGLPEISVLDSRPAAEIELREVGGRSEVDWSGRWIPAVPFAEAVGLRSAGTPQRMIVVSTTSGPVALLVEEETGRRQVAARELGPVLAGVPHLTGAALLGGGEIIVLVDPSRLADRARVHRDEGPRHRVLVVDDSRAARQVVGGALGSVGFEVDLAGSPTEALSVLAATSFDAIVLDYLMPTMDGATLAQRVRALGIDVPIVMLSGVATGEDASRALGAGANAYLDKDDVRKGALASVLSELIAGIDH
jgi:two-component system, chemotaxis family, sensor kinase CheA